MRFFLTDLVDILYIEKLYLPRRRTWTLATVGVKEVSLGIPRLDCASLLDSWLIAKTLLTSGPIQRRLFVGQSRTTQDSLNKSSHP